MEFSNVALLSFHPGWLAFEYSIFVDSNTNRTCRYCIHCISMILGVPKFDIESMNHMLASCADPTLLTPLKAVVWLTAITHDQIISNLSTLTNLRFLTVLGMKLMAPQNMMAPVEKKHATQHSLSVFPGRPVR